MAKQIVEEVIEHIQLGVNCLADLLLRFNHAGFVLLVVVYDELHPTDELIDELLVNRAKILARLLYEKEVAVALVQAQTSNKVDDLCVVLLKRTHNR